MDLHIRISSPKQVISISVVLASLPCGERKWQPNLYLLGKSSDIRWSTAQLRFYRSYSLRKSLQRNLQSKDGKNQLGEQPVARWDCLSCFPRNLPGNSEGNSGSRLYATAGISVRAHSNAHGSFLET